MLKFLLFPILKMVSFFWVKNKHIWVFGAWFGKRYSDNSRVLFEYVYNNEKNITPVWICSDKKVIKYVTEKGGKAFHYSSFKGILYQLSASKAFISHSLSADLMPGCFCSKTQVFQLYHGIPLKKIMYDALPNKGIAQKIKNKLKKEIDWQSYIISTSKFTQEILSKAFEHPLEKVLITGLPRNDILVNSRPELGKTLDSFDIYYMPTLRSSSKEYDFFSQNGFSATRIDEQLKENGIQLYIRVHPVNVISEDIKNVVMNCDNIHIDKTDDIYESLKSCSCLITDYSSIIFDYLLLNKPIVFFGFDHKEYLIVERDLYIDFSELLSVSNAQNWSEVLTQVLNIKNNTHIANQNIEKLKYFKRKYHTECNGGYSKNILEFIKSNNL